MQQQNRTISGWLAVAFFILTVCICLAQNSAPVTPFVIWVPRTVWEANPTACAKVCAKIWQLDTNSADDRAWATSGAQRVRLISNTNVVGYLYAVTEEQVRQAFTGANMQALYRIYSNANIRVERGMHLFDVMAKYGLEPDVPPRE